MITKMWFRGRDNQRSINANLIFVVPVPIETGEYTCKIRPKTNVWSKDRDKFYGSIRLFNINIIPKLIWKSLGDTKIFINVF